MRRLMIVVAALGALSACGSTAPSGRQVASLSTEATGDATSNTGSNPGDATDTTTPTDPAEAALAFAKCMRDHGVDVPDPVVQDGGASGGGGVMIAVNGGPDGSTPFDATAMDEANKACQPIMEKAAGSFDPPSPEELEKMKAQALAFAKCMREHGVDMPDPQFGDNGTITQSIGGPTGSGPPRDFDPKAMQAASEACGQGGPGGGGFGITIGTAP
jgi:hypothetical protein